MAQCSLGAPLDVVAGCFLDYEGLAAALVAIVVDALFYREVHDGTRGDFGCCVLIVSQKVYIVEVGGYIRFMEVFGLMQPVATRPAVRIACGDGIYILVLVDEEDLND
jgi:hypothetical protein